MRMWNTFISSMERTRRNERKKKPEYEPSRHCLEINVNGKTLTITWFMDDDIGTFFTVTSNWTTLRMVVIEYQFFFVCVYVLEFRRWNLAKPKWNVPRWNAYKCEFAKVCWHYPNGCVQHTLVPCFVRGLCVLKKQDAKGSVELKWQANAIDYEICIRLLICSEKFFSCARDICKWMMNKKVNHWFRWDAKHLFGSWLFFFKQLLVEAAALAHQCQYGSWFRKMTVALFDNKLKNGRKRATRSSNKWIHLVEVLNVALSWCFVDGFYENSQRNTRMEWPKFHQWAQVGKK